MKLDPPLSPLRDFAAEDQGSMGKSNSLLDLIGRLHNLDPNATIYAADPWTEESIAIAAYEPDSGDPPEEAARLGLTYFLETFIALEVLEGWQKTLGRNPSPEELCERLIRYAINDA